MLQTCDVHCCVSVQENAIKTILQKKKNYGVALSILIELEQSLKLFLIIIVLDFQRMKI